MTREPAKEPQRFIRLAAALREELAQLRRIVVEAQRALADFSSREPSLLELRGIGDVLHDFYTAAERIFEKIAPELNGGLPLGPSWHRELLENMALDLPGVRPPLLRRDTVRVLEEYLRFRHRFRNVYGFQLEWSKVRPLLERLNDAWCVLETDTSQFLLFLDAVGKSG